MVNVKQDRRVKRTQQMLMDALQALIEERGYDALTIQDITEYANVGRTTFYLHFQSKDDLLVSSIRQHIVDFSFGMKSAGDWLCEIPTTELVEFFKKSREEDDFPRRFKKTFRNREVFHALNRVISQQMEENLRVSFAESEFILPLPLLAHAMASTHLSLVRLWPEKRPSYTAEEMANTSHRLMRSMLVEALGGKRNQLDTNS